MRSFKRATVGNRLLASLPASDYADLQPAMETVDVVFGQILVEPGAAVGHVYFPHDAVISLLTRVDDHQSIEVGLIGPEGMLGATLALGLAVSPVRALVQGGGTATRIKSADFLRELRRSAALQALFHAFPNAVMRFGILLALCCCFVWWPPYAAACASA